MRAEWPAPTTAVVRAAVAGHVGGVVGVGHPVTDASGRVLLAVGGVPVAPDGVRPGERAGGVDDRGGGDAGQRAVGGPNVHGERLVLPPGVDDAVAPTTGDTDDRGAVADPVAEGVAEWLQVGVGPLPPEGVAVGVWGRPAAALEEPASGRVDELGPLREESHVAPVAHRVGGARPALEDDGVEPALDEVRGGGEADRSRTDHDDRLGRPGGGVDHDNSLIR